MSQMIHAIPSSAVVGARDVIDLDQIGGVYGTAIAETEGMVVDCVVEGFPETVVTCQLGFLGRFSSF